MNTNLRRKLYVLFLSVCLALMAVSLPATQTAYADLRQCRSDPLVLLSDGTILDISADVGTWLWNVEQVHYDLHIPAGLRVVLAVSTPNWPTTIERFTVHADNPPNTFTAITKVVTRQTNVPVTANFLLNLQYQTLGGLSGQPLAITLTDN